MEELTLPKKFKAITKDFVTELENTYKGGLVSVILYGSSLSGEFSRGYSDVNLLVVLTDTSLDNLSKIKKIATCTKYAPIRALFFTEDYIRSSRDVFPIEFLDMKTRHVLIYGKDILKDLAIDSRNLRFQTEHELKSLSIRVKQFYLVNRNRSLLKAALFRFLTSFMHISKNENRFGADPAVLRKILDAKSGKSKLSYRDTEALYLEFAGVVEKIATLVDNL